jgi:hypothetical protein
MCDNLKHTQTNAEENPDRRAIGRRCRSLPPPSPLRNFLGAGQKERASHQNIQRRSLFWLLFFYDSSGDLPPVAIFKRKFY